MKLRLIFTLFLITCIGVLSATLYYSFTTESREDYASFLQNHPFHPKNRWKKDFESLPKQDRPDLAWEQNFLMTMDPALKRPTPERLLVARERIRKHFSSKGRTGTEAFPWIERGPTNVGGRTRAIAWDPNDPNGTKVWAGGVTGGLWYTEDIYDADMPWKRVDDFWANISITSIAFDPTNTSILYVGTGEGFGAGSTRGAGIWKSTDGGSTWIQLPATSEVYYINDLAVRDEDGSAVLYAATEINAYEGSTHFGTYEGLLRSTDGGSSFTQVMPNVPGSSSPYAIADIEIGADNKLWVGSSDNSSFRGGGAILYSQNGVSWTLSTKKTGAGRVELACAPSNASVVYALLESNSAVSHVLKTLNSGTSWSEVSMPVDSDEGIQDDFSRGQAWYDLILAVDPNNSNIVIAGAIDLFKTTNGGSTWQQLSHWYGGYGFPYVHADQHAIVYKPGSSSDVIFGNDGGISLSVNMNDPTPSFINRNNNYNVTQFYSCAIHPQTSRDYFLAGSQDNGTQKFTSSGLNSTTEATGGDGAYCFIDQQKADIQISSYVYNSYYISTNSGLSFVEFQYEETSGFFINPADYDDNLGILYTAATSSSIGRYLDVKTGNPIRQDLSVPLGELASHLRVSPYTTTSTTLYVGTAAGRLFRIENADTTPSQTEITGNNFPNGYISCVEIGTSNDHLFVTFSNFGVTSIFETKNGGITWTSKEANLPDMPVRWALYNPTNYHEAIVATDLGVWRTTDLGSSAPTWTPSNVGLANVRVDMLQIRESDYEVIAATHGRGLYSSSGFVSEDVMANFSASAKDILIDGNVDFTDYSKGQSGNSITHWEWSFEGGSPATSTEQHPRVSYSDPGSYDVELKVTDSAGNTHTRIMSDIINVVSNLGMECESILNSSLGTFDDGSGNLDYENEFTCSWIIRIPGATFITLQFDEFDVEEDYDFLNIYQANNLNTPLYRLSGTTLPEEITINDSQLALVFETDQLVTGEGWQISYTSDGSQLPDIMLGSMTSEQTGSQLNIGLEATNVGDADLNAGVTLDFFLSDDELWGENDTKLFESSIEKLEAGQQLEINHLIEVPLDLPSGIYYLIAIADANNSLQERNELNNTIIFMLSFKVLSDQNIPSPGFKIYPIPTSHAVTIESANSAIYRYSIMDLSGKILLHGKGKAENTELNLHHFAHGVYQLMIEQGDEVKFYRILKE